MIRAARQLDAIAIERESPADRHRVSGHASVRGDAADRQDADSANDRVRDHDFAKHMRANQKPARKADGTPSPDGPQQPEQRASLTEIVAAWLGSKHAEGPSVVIGAGKPAAPTATPSAPAAGDTNVATDATAPATTAQPAKPELPLTPLEQAVHDLLGELDHAEREQDPAGTDAPQPITTPLAAAPSAELEHATDVLAPQPVAPPAPLAQPAEQAITHYTHLVLDDGTGVQVSMRIAVRGSTVNVALKSNDDATAAALARNAGSLDEAIRGRGLDMNNFTAERDSDRSQRHREQRERDQPSTERFQLEENRK